MVAAGPAPTHASDAIARLEARVRWLTALVSFLSLGFVGLLAWEFVPRSRLVEAQRFVLRDARWNRRAELGLREDGSPMLRLNDARGRERAMLFAREGGPVVMRLVDSQGAIRARFQLDPGGTPELLLAGPDGRTRTRLAPSSEGGPGLALYDQRLRSIWSAP